jgi:hypothetical protein
VDAESDGDAESVGDAELDGDAEPDGDAGLSSDGDAEPDGDAGSDEGSRNGDADADGDADEDTDSGGDGWLDVTVLDVTVLDAAVLDVTVHRKLTEPVAPDEDVAVTVTSYVPDAAGEMVPVISPLSLIDKPGGRSDAANCGGCPSAALSDVTCNWIAVPTAFCWSLGSSRRTAAWRK